MKTKQILVLVCLFSTFLLFSCTNPGAKMDAASDKNKETAVTVMNMFASGTMDDASMYIADNIVEHTPDPNISATGMEGVKATSAMYHGSFPDLKFNILNSWSEGDMVIVHYNITGTNSGMMGEMPATNKSMSVDGVDIFKFNAEGKITDHWGYSEEMKMMTQLGMMQDEPEMPMDSTMTEQMKM